MEVYNECLRKSSEENFVHFTFDFSQSVTMPHHARQTGPLYFPNLRKVHIFGVRIDGQRKQINFLVDEDQTIGQDGSQAHGPDSVISMLDWVMSNYETENDVHPCR
ncbi:hypothetical protein DPMN_036237 [Dreissena polymorpha]|uniref:Uncharacterized protein n=1 Tax=Dreissena polymorpha TaxID=45954 RepID=A0A9D4MCK6_DREPO|nr:hypothetical protein DPMN_036237 [Dreissena polymorpha]